LRSAIVERGPGVDCPSVVDDSIRAQQRIPAGLSNVGKVFDVREEAEMAKGMVG
jgi:hypothetical protein